MDERERLIEENLRPSLPIESGNLRRLLPDFPPDAVQKVWESIVSPNFLTRVDLSKETPEEFAARLHGYVVDEVKQDMEGIDLNLSAEDTAALVSAARILKRTADKHGYFPRFFEDGNSGIDYGDVIEKIETIAEVFGTKDVG